MTADLYSQYRESAVTQAEPVKLVEMMYEGGVRFILRAKRAIAGGDAEDAHNNILRAYAIIAELMATLDFEQGGEIATRLEQCYEFMLHLLKEADIRKDAALLDQVLKLLEPMLDTWREAFGAMARTAVSPATNGNGQATAAENGNGKPQIRKPLDITG